MPRPAGSRNRDYTATRHGLARAVVPHLLDEHGEVATLQALAAAAGVSVPTLRHYFGDRDELFRAALRSVTDDAAVHLAAMADPADAEPEQRLTQLALGLTGSWRRYGLGAVFATGLARGLRSPTRGPAFLDELLEPFLQAAELLLARLVDQQRLPPLDPRETALSLLGPVLLALLHQHDLGGTARRPLDLDGFARRHVRLVLRGLAPAPA